MKSFFRAWRIGRVLLRYRLVDLLDGTPAERFDPDWQQPFARVFGDVLGVQIANALAAGLRHAKVAAKEFAGNAAEFVTEESRDVVPREELAAFHDDVDALRDDVERLAARVARLPPGGPA